MSNRFPARSGDAGSGFGVGTVEFAGGVSLLVSAGLLVGFGTRVGLDCTSSHGVCGLANLCRRSFMATAVFMGMGIGMAMLTDYVVGEGLYL